LQVSYDRAVDCLPDDFVAQVYRAAGRSEVRDAVVKVYEDLQREIDARRPRCDASGRCCRFEEFDHRLFVTTIELATFLYELETRDWPPREKWNGAGCPFQVGGLCSVHPIRPYGCRIFFCDATAASWQHEQYERFHARLKRLHQELDVPYIYMEWRSALRALDLPELAQSQFSFDSTTQAGKLSTV